MNSNKENIKLKIEKLSENDPLLDRVVGGRTIYGIWLGAAKHCLIDNLNNPNGYFLEYNKWILIDEEAYTVIGEYGKLSDMNEAAKRLKINDPTVEYVLTDSGMLEYMLDSNDGSRYRNSMI